LEKYIPLYKLLCRNPRCVCVCVPNPFRPISSYSWVGWLVYERFYGAKAIYAHRYFFLWQLLNVKMDHCETPQ